LLRMMFSSSIYLPANDKISFFFMVDSIPLCVNATFSYYFCWLFSCTFFSSILLLSFLLFSLFYWNRIWHVFVFVLCSAV
jgi:hypothetical protein